MSLSLSKLTPIASWIREPQLIQYMSISNSVAPTPRRRRLSKCGFGLIHGLVRVQEAACRPLRQVHWARTLLRCARWKVARLATARGFAGSPDPF